MTTSLCLDGTGDENIPDEEIVAAAVAQPIAGHTHTQKKNTENIVAVDINIFCVSFFFLVP